jgi:hypothetical protein
MLILFLIISSIFPSRGEEYCEIAEINHFYNYDAEPVFTQLIIWEWSDIHKQNVVRHWSVINYSKLKENGTNECIDIHKNGNVYSITWNDKQNGYFRVIKTKVLKETWTQKDRERENQSVLPQELRNKLIFRKISK